MNFKPLKSFTLALLVALTACQQEEVPLEELEEEKVEEESTEKLTVFDIDGNGYSTFQVAGKEWLVQNLRTTRYANGDRIPQVSEPEVWTSLTSGAYSWYNNDQKSDESKGKLYNWYSIQCCPICPTGWRIPTYEEYSGLVDHYGNSLWNISFATPTKRLSIPEAMGAEWRNPNGNYDRVLENGRQFTGFWSSTTRGDSHAFIVYISTQTFRLDRGKIELSFIPKTAGISVKCIKI
jgi:uncharacterized protein (TIGR02145 family)